jgi:hypothetical protein
MDETLARTLNSFKTREPVSYGPLHVFPLCDGGSAKEDFFLLDGGLQAGTLRVVELNEAGSVPELRVINEGISGYALVGEAGVLHATALAG